MPMLSARVSPEARMLVCTLVATAMSALLVPVSAEPARAVSADVTVNLEFSIGDISFLEGLEFRRLSAICASVEISTGGVRCPRASLRAADTPWGPLSLAADARWTPAGRYSVHAAGRLERAGRIEISLQSDDGGRRMQLTLQEFDLTAAAVMFGDTPMLYGHTLDGGTVSLRADCSEQSAVRTQCTIEGTIDALTLNGANVAEDLGARFGARLAVGPEGAAIDGNVELTEGALYVEPGFETGGFKPGFFVDIGAQPITLAARIEGLGSPQMSIRSVTLGHPGVVDMHFAGDLRFDPGPRWNTLEFSFGTTDLARFYRTYLQPLTLGTALASIETSGGIHLALTGTHDEIDEFAVRFDEVYLDDDRGRFSLYGVDGEIELHAGSEPRESHVSWIGGALYKVPIGGGRIDWTSAHRNLHVANWQDVELFDGVLRLDTLEVRNFSLDATEVALSGRLTPVTLSAVTAAFGWMPLSGKLSGEIPLLTYSANHLRLDGDLDMKIFDGVVTIRDLEIDGLFSTVPVLKAEVEVDQLSLEALTRTFSFGYITGHLDGRIDDLVLQAWQPIHFDAWFVTPADDTVPHRISRQAVDNLGRLGAGTGSALSQGWLSFIPSYSYGQLGIGCRLLNEHCQMRGVERDEEGGFFILTRGGIFPPWIDVKGSGRRIRWQTLVDGIKQISRGKVELNIGRGGARKP